jgi:hypothetical protein
MSSKKALKYRFGGKFTFSREGVSLIAITGNNSLQRFFLLRAARQFAL